MKKNVMKKVAIVGAGNAACISALSLYLQKKILEQEIEEIEIYHDPSVPIARVGQGTIPSLTLTISQVLGVDYFNNKIKATAKNGILYENWGKNTPLHFHPFLMHAPAIHYSPNLLSKAVLESGLFKVTDANITDPESQIDADMIFDCRGWDKENKDSYRKLINPLNSVILWDKKGRDPDILWTKCVATPNGWTFVIPNVDSVSYGYLYNKDITSKEDAEKNFIDMFDAEPDGYLRFENYIAKNMFVGDRTVLNGNRLAFIEPLEATSTSFYQTVCGASWYGFVNDDKEYYNDIIQSEIEKIQNFIMWHYSKGSIYDTPFWNYAQNLSKGTFDRDEEFMDIMVAAGQSMSEEDMMVRWDDPRKYSQFNYSVIKNWHLVS